ncbi:MAG TPA: hypothetical protein VIW47_03755 [Nitrospiraceae bacterium]
MNWLEGSWTPNDPLIGGPPGIPGSPRPTEPKLFPVLELTEEPTPGAGTDVGPALAWPGTTALGTTCKDCPA